MTARRDVRPEVLDAAFEFARRQDDPAFRAHLRQHGWEPGVDVVIALDGDSVVSVVRRLVINGTSAPCLIAIPAPSEPYGFALMLAAPGHEPADAAEVVKITRESTIGMVWSSMQRCGEFVPDHWAQPVLFEKVPVDA